MKLPHEVEVIINTFRNVWKQDIYLTGGAVRDFVLGKTIRDYDIYLRAGNNDVDELMILGDRLGFTTKHVTGHPNYGGAYVQLSKTGLEVEIMIEEDRNIIEYINDFPVNLSKVYLKEDGTVHKSAAFVDYEETGKIVFSFDRAGGTAEKHKEYALKIIGKFING